MHGLASYVAAAASHNPIEEQLVAVLTQLVVIIVAARGAATLARRLGQPAVVGEIVAGLLLGPSVLGHLRGGYVGGPVHAAWLSVFHPPGDALAHLPDVFAMLSQLGLIFLLFLIGLEFDFRHLRDTRGASLTISVAGVVLPFSLGLGLGWLMFPHLGMEAGKRVGFVLFMGTAMSITAIPILGRIMMEMNIARTRIGAVTITAAAVDDATGWILLATVSALVQTGFSPRGTGLMLAESVGYALLMIVVARPLLRAWARRAVTDGQIGLNGLAVLIVVLFASAIATSKIGIFAIFGAFLLGAILSDEPAFRDAVVARLRDFVTAFFLPIFFTYTGLKTDVGSVGGPLMWAFAAAVSAAAIAGKFGGCAAAARWSGFAARESVLIGVMMNTRALMELIVVNVGFKLGVIPASVFCMLVLMAVVTTVMTAPLMLVAIRGTDLEPLVRGSGFLRRRNAL